MYIRAMQDSIRRILSKILSDRYEDQCSQIKPGVYKCCGNEYVLALYKVKNWSLNIHELTHLDYIFNLKKFLDVFSLEHCRSLFLTDVELVDIDRYLAKLNQTIQTKLLELELDKTNVKLKTYIEKLLENRSKVLKGLRPIKVLNVIALTCNKNVSIRDLDKVIHNAENVLNMDLDPITDSRYAEAIAKFCS